LILQAAPLPTYHDRIMRTVTTPVPEIHRSTSTVMSTLGDGPPGADGPMIDRAADRRTPTAEHFGGSDGRDHAAPERDSDAAAVRAAEQMRRAASGDKAALDALWAEHRRWVAVVLLAHKPANLELDDLMQEVAMTLVARVGDVHSAATFRPWLRMVAINAARAAGRSARVRETRSIDGDSADLRKSRSAELDDEASRMLDLVDELPESYREPLLLRSLQEMTTRQIATLLDLPETTIETRVSRARRMLRERRESLETTGHAERPRQFPAQQSRKPDGQE